MLTPLSPLSPFLRGTDTSEKAPVSTLPKDEAHCMPTSCFSYLVWLLWQGSRCAGGSAEGYDCEVKAEGGTEETQSTSTGGGEAGAAGMEAPP